MTVGKNQTDKTAEVPDSLIEILCQRGRYEEEMLERIKDAFDKNDQRKVFRLVGKLLYEGPGTVPLSPINEQKSKGKRPQRQTR
jgi:hypothetical protein